MTVTEQEITDYVARVRAALADLPATQRDELTEDLADHLTEVAAEAEGTLVERLGEPETYAAELRAAAGAAPGGGGRNLDQRVAAALVRVRSRLRAVDTQFGPPLGYAHASDFLRLLRPGWWVLRGYLAAMLVTVISTGGSFGLLPRFGGELLAGLIMLVGFVLASIWLGRRSAQLTRWPRSAVQVGSAVLVVFALVGLVDAEGRHANDYYYDQTSVDSQYSRVRDVFVYDSEGRLVENARLFDQDGNPIRLGYPDCASSVNDYGAPLLRPYPYCVGRAPFGPRAPAGSDPIPTPPASSSPPAEPTSTPPTEPTGTPTAGPTSTPTAGATATGEPSADPTATPAGTPSPTPTS
ncbi:HAAS signaling domain-containing protein [Micromonospora sp. NPDC048935]|uniref:HAAS signaling domain-containing protein n=1 Tax=Micromonospora sp. NPDC048935 TaxID=3364262 RepID=UPI003710BD8C